VISLRYFLGWSLVSLSRLLRRVVGILSDVAALPEQLAVVVWTPREIDRYSRGVWNRRDSVRRYSRRADGLSPMEKALFEGYLVNGGELLDLACGGGREALCLAEQGLKVTACDWSPRMIAEAQRRAQDANLPIRFEVADLYDLRYPENAFDYALITNVAYSYLIPRRRRIRFLEQVYSFLKPGGLFIVAFAREGALSRNRVFRGLLATARRRPPFNRDYEPGDLISFGEFIHLFQPEALRDELEESRFVVKEWLGDQGYAVLAKP